MFQLARIVAIPCTTSCILLQHIRDGRQRQNAARVGASFARKRKNIHPCVQTSRHLASPDRGDPVPHDSSPLLARAPNPRETRQSACLTDLTPQRQEKDFRHCAPRSHHQKTYQRKLFPSCAVRTRRPMRRPREHSKEAAPDTTHCENVKTKIHRAFSGEAKGGTARLQKDAKRQMGQNFRLHHSLVADGTLSPCSKPSKWIAERSNLTWDLVSISFALPTS